MQVKSDTNIHGCIVPHLPANLNATLRPFHLDKVSESDHSFITEPPRQFTVAIYIAITSNGFLSLSIQDSIPKHTLIVDGLMNELQLLSMGVRLLLLCMKRETGSCNF